MNSNLAERYRRNPKVEESPLQGELMLFESESGRFFVLNRTMAYLWRRCQGEMTVEQIVEAVPNEFRDVDSQRVASEMRAALQELVGLGLVTSV